MKKLVLATLATVAGVVAVMNPSYSQKAANAVRFENEVTVSLEQPFTSAVSTANLKAMKHFKKSFTEAKGERWFRVKNGYMAEFRESDSRYRIEYDKKGNWSGTEKGYTENRLKSNLRTMIKSVYFDYNINWVKEIAVPDALIGPVYFINIESASDIKNICLYNGEMKVIGEYRKG